MHIVLTELVMRDTSKDHPVLTFSSPLCRVLITEDYLPRTVKGKELSHGDTMSLPSSPKGTRDSLSTVSSTNEHAARAQ